ncbi:hypothetical protein TIFTF001_000578 [Ficus carica]|uniref:Pentatricopeptide repeat-containing protein n=1 Tax=Ficus carica TaxID=3494 RepID=A0AA87Z3E6_FICCA|nr:hypothetical protein TIFTF001_000578 [Ficus carica]
MSLFLRRPTKPSLFLRRFPLSQPASSFLDGQLLRFSSAELRSAPRGRRQERRRVEGQVRVPRGSSLPLSGLLHSSLHRDFHCSCRQIQVILSHSASFSDLQEQMPLKFRILSANHNNSRENTVNFDSLIHYRRFSSHSTDSDSDSGTDVESCNGDENEMGYVGSGVDLKEVENVCKVLDEMSVLDRNMEAVLDECGIRLSHDLVVEVLERFKHARKPAFRFFCWAGEKPEFAHDSKTYNSMMSILGKTRQFETMVSMLEEMGEKGVLTMETFVIAIKAFAAAKERKKAVGMFELMKEYKFEVGVDTVNCLLDALGRAKLGKEAQALFEKLKGRFTPDLQTYTVLLNGWCRLKNLMEAGKLWNEMIDLGFKPDVVAHNVMLDGLLRSKKRSDAIKLFEVMKAKGPRPNIRSYMILIREFCKQGKMKEAVECFDDLLESGGQPDAAVYTCLITGFGNQRNMDTVFELLKEMKEKGHTPDGRLYNALIKLMASRKMPDDATRIYKRMIKCGIKPTIHTYNMIMKSYFQTRNFKMGHAAWDEMIRKGCSPDDNSYTVFIGALIRQGKSGEACKYIEEMLEKGMKAPQLDYNKFAADFSRAGKPNILEELAQKMKVAGKFEVSNVFSRQAEMMKKRVKRRDHIRTNGKCN